MYLRFMCRGGSIRSPYKKHDDPLYHADAVEVFLDPKGDGREWIKLEVSPNNVVFDQLDVLTTEPVYDPDGTLTSDVLACDWWTDLSWDLTGPRTAARRMQRHGETSGWVIDLAVPADPLRRLGIKPFRPMRLRTNLLRYETQPGVNGKSVFLPMNWAPVRFGCPHISPAAMGTLVLDPPTPRK
ncbi:MAG: carbohydrate-binding family 9-like protein [Janthinobacterium lividum]